MHEIKSILEHKHVKGNKGYHFKVVWANHDPTWEPESSLKETAG